MTCKHKASTVMEYHGPFTLCECNHECGEVFVTVTGGNGISYQFTADELLIIGQISRKQRLGQETAVSQEVSA